MGKDIHTVHFTGIQNTGYSQPAASTAATDLGRIRTQQGRLALISVISLITKCIPERLENKYLLWFIPQTGMLHDTKESVEHYPISFGALNEALQNGEL